MIIYEKIFNNHGLSQTQKKAIELVGQDKKILEIGSSSGYMTKFFLENNCEVDVIEVDSNAISKVSKKVKKAINKSIEDQSVVKFLSKDYNFIIMADVIEHLVYPEKALLNLKKVSNNNTKLIISTPNIACWAIRKELFFKGLFEYQESGILDKTHLHLFSVNSLPRFLNQNGWQVKEIKGTITRLPLEGFISRIPILNFIYFGLVKNFIVEKFNNLGYVHFIIIATQ